MHSILDKINIYHLFTDDCLLYHRRLYCLTIGLAGELAEHKTGLAGTVTGFWKHIRICWKVSDLSGLAGTVTEHAGTIPKLSELAGTLTELSGLVGIATDLSGLAGTVTDLSGSGLAGTVTDSSGLTKTVIDLTGLAGATADLSGLAGTDKVTIGLLLTEETADTDKELIAVSAIVELDNGRRAENKMNFLLTTLIHKTLKKVTDRFSRITNNSLPVL